MMMRRIGLILAVLLFLTGVGLGAEEVVKKITVLGNAKIEEGVIRGAIKTREGGSLSMDQVREDLRSIFGLGYFSDVQVDIKPVSGGREVIFVVVEKPSVKEILITGNQKIKTEDIKEKMTLTARSILNLDKIKENAEQIRKLYFSKGYYGVQVEPKVENLDTNEAVVSFKIDEGPKGAIDKILFKGNQRLKSDELKKVMATKEKGLLSFLTKTGILDEDALKNDVQLLSAYYFDHGYLDVKISEPKVDLHDPKKIQIEIGIEEGSQYHFGTIDFKGDLLNSKEELFRAVGLKRNDVYSNTAIRKAVTALTERFANQGHAYVEVSPETAVDSSKLLVGLTFDIDKKKQVSFERIQIRGNTKTRDKVIRRELQVAEGELYSATGINKSRDRLKRTGYFKEAEFVTSRGSADDKINMDIKVEEAPTGALSFGIGYSSLEKAIGTASLSDRNLFGLGYAASLKFRLGTESKDFRLSVTDPYFLGYRYSVGTDFYSEEIDYFSTYSYKMYGGNLRVGKELTETLRTDLTYKLENVDVFNISPEASNYVLEQSGRKTTSALAMSVSKDTRNDFFSPLKGAKHVLMVQNAGGPLGGDNYFVKAVGETNWYFPLPLNTVLNLRAKAGVVQAYGSGPTEFFTKTLTTNPITGKNNNAEITSVVRDADKTVPIYERFFVGGQGTIRGFEYGKAGPVDENEDPIGATKMVVFTGEWVFPLSREIGLRGALFVDVGRGWGVEQSHVKVIDERVNPKEHVFVAEEPSWRVGVGFGIRWFSPFGPINIDIGFNPSPKSGEKTRVIDFSAGTTY
jgi:outer membrane protein insertion porin family